MTTRIGLLGYGIGGRIFHAPFIQASDACELVGVVTSSPGRAQQVRDDLPGVAVCDDLDALVELGVDAVTVSTPPHTHHALALEAISRGLHVVVDKPFMPDAETGRAVAEAAREAGVLLNVFHNRRFDTDLVTAAGVVDSGALGALERIELHCEQDDPATIEQGPTGGMLRDLGSHVVDQALRLGGPPVAVTADLAWRDLPGGRTDVGFTLLIRHESGAVSAVYASKANRLVSRRLVLFGRNGSYVSDYSDVQQEALMRGERPAGDRARWGYEDRSRWGTLATVGDPQPVPSEQGDYTRYYDAFGRAVADGGSGPVPPEQGIAVLQVLDAARRSDSDGRTVEIAR